MGGKEEKGNSLARPERTRLGPTGAAWSSLDWICRPTLQATLRVPLFPWPEQDQQGLGCWVVAHPSRKARGHLSGGPRWMVDSEAKYGGPLPVPPVDGQTKQGTCVLFVLLALRWTCSTVFW